MNMPEFASKPERKGQSFYAAIKLSELWRWSGNRESVYSHGDVPFLWQQFSGARQRYAHPTGKSALGGFCG
jgi:hypothetical protein